MSRAPDTRPVSTPNAPYVQREYARFAAGYDARWSHYVHETTSLALAQLPLRAGARVLDVGCGTGTLLHRALVAEPSITVVGLDLTHEMLQQARAHLEARAVLAQASGVALPLRDASVDLAVCTSALHYMPSPDAVLREMVRVLVPGGILVVTDWCTDYWTMRALDRLLRLADPAHVACRCTSELETLFLRAGFTLRSASRTKIDRFWGIMTVSGHT